MTGGSGKASDSVGGKAGGGASYLLRKYVRPLMAEGLVVFTIPESPRAPNQKYETTDLGEQVLKSLTPN